MWGQAAASGQAPEDWAGMTPTTEFLKNCAERIASDAVDDVAAAAAFEATLAGSGAIRHVCGAMRASRVSR